MSIQEIEKSHIVSGSQGLDRTIDASSQKMVLDILQVTQYSKPIDSSIRELASNAVDSQREKEIAIEILTGQSKVDDYFVERKGSQYEASKFDKSYYDLKRLDVKNNNVEIYYTEYDTSGFSDEFVVKDYGVGIGDDRLRGITKLGYSTKRNSTQTLGAFGWMIDLDQIKLDELLETLPNVNNVERQSAAKPSETERSETTCPIAI